MEFHELIERALRVRALYAQLEQTRYGRSWESDEIALGFVGDVGDLAKLILAQNGVRDIPNSRDKLAHELYDCLQLSSLHTATVSTSKLFSSKIWMRSKHRLRGGTWKINHWFLVFR